MNTWILTAIMVGAIAIVGSFFLYNSKKRQAFYTMRRYGSKFGDTLGCSEACGYYYDAIEKHNFFGILFSEIGYKDAADFQKTAIKSLEQRIAYVEAATAEFCRERDTLIVKMSKPPSVDDLKQMLELLQAIEKSSEEAHWLKIDLAYLKEPHVFSIGNKALFQRLFSLIRGDGRGFKTAH